MLIELALFSSAAVYWLTRHQTRPNRTDRLISKKSSPTNQVVPPTSSAESNKQHELAKKNIDRSLSIVFLGTVSATLGILFYRPLYFVSAPLVAYAGGFLLKRTYQQLKQKKVTVDTMVTITVFGCLATGNFWLASLTMLIPLTAMRLMLNVTEDSRGKLIDIFKQFPKSAWVIIDGIEIDTPLEQIKTGQTVIVNAGEIIPVDGTISAGRASIDQHILTGEAQPDEKEVGDSVFAMTTVLAGRIDIQVEKAGQQTTAAQIGEVLNKTIDYKSTMQLRTQTLANNTVVPTLIVGGLTLPFIGPIGSLALLNTHIKYKMNFITPISLMNYLRLASEQGVLIKDGRSLELLDQVDTIVFDKTGTLTQEQPHIGAIYSVDDTLTKNQLLIYAAAAEKKQSHPIARAIVEAADERQLTLPEIEEAEYQLGYGLTVTINGQRIRVGSHRFMERSALSIPNRLAEIQTHCHAQGHSLVMVAVDDKVVGGIELLPTIRSDAKQVIQTLRQNPKINAIYIISGDHEAPTKKLAHDLGIDHYFAETLPEEKAELIEQLQQQGSFVCYVGDGINDSIALKKSQVSISLKGASSVAVDTAQIILMDEQLSHLPTLFEFAESFHHNTNTNFAIVLMPMFLGVGGILFFHLGLAYSIVLNLLGVVAGVGNAMLPLAQDKLKRLNSFRQPN